MKRFSAIPLSIMTCLVELYSSEGCSSCPPADEWMAGLRNNPKLWHSFVPVEFHFDYWNRLGWTDRFSQEDFTRRQSRFASAWGNDNVYTPGRVLDGQEWRESYDVSRLTASGGIVGKLVVERISETRFKVHFSPEIHGSRWVAYGALLGNGLKSSVKSGENSGRTLKHEFVAFTIAQSSMTQAKGAYEAELELKTEIQKLMSADAKSTSIAVWIARAGSQAPVQAVGGDLP